MTLVGPVETHRAQVGRDLTINPETIETMRPLLLLLKGPMQCVTVFLAGHHHPLPPRVSLLLGLD